jgi:hypothetical protein
VNPAGQTNGVAERFIRTLKENSLLVRHFATAAELIEALQEFQRRYDACWWIERHGYRSPAQVRRNLAAPIPAVASIPGSRSPGRWKVPTRLQKKVLAPVDSGSGLPDIY